MGKYETVDIILGILYASGALVLMVVSYRLYIRRFKRNKLEAKNQVVFTTSRQDLYKNKTQFLVTLSDPSNVRIALLDQDETEVMTVIDEDMLEGENIVEFNPEGKVEGIYYLSLTTIHTKILRKIRITT